eukprot:TRINITY_DN77998_c0_g1_i1.p1 TRINITY_DN77998_c0_g1~~TRINITY_DN77998_c0_g1_i1.p1  ORF type:complete len:593 (+),score=81.33 TRINITY_DN77998_c0_g1_i1:42-1820(+)
MVAKRENDFAVTFLVHAETVQGEQIRIVGSCPELGSWNADLGIDLATDAGLYPRWRATVYFRAPPEQSAIVVNYKYVRDHTFKGAGLLWESLPEENQPESHSTRSVCLEPASSSPGSSTEGEWLVCDPGLGLLRTENITFIPKCKVATDGCFANAYVLDSIGESLGFGAFGTVSRCFPAESENGHCHCLAAKQIVKSGLKQRDADNLFGPTGAEGEIGLHMAQKHPNIVRLVEVFDEPGQVTIVMEACDGGDLLSHIQDHKRAFSVGFSEQAASVLLSQLLSALDYLHQQRIVHRDTKCENILLLHRNIPLEKNSCKLCDFGLAARLSEKGTLQTPVGSLDYAAPEVLQKAACYGTPADLWAAGVIWFMVLSGIPPFFAETDRDVVQKIRKCEYSLHGDLWDKVSENVKSNLRGLLCVDPDRRRATADAVLDSTWDQMKLSDGPCIPVTFYVHAQTQMGEILRLVGSSAEIGEWKPDSGVVLTTNAGLYPQWKATVHFKAPPGQRSHMDVQYKYILDRRSSGQGLGWESMSWNRHFRLMLEYDSENAVPRWSLKQSKSNSGSEPEVDQARKHQSTVRADVNVSLCQFDHFNT